MMLTAKELYCSLPQSEGKKQPLQSLSSLRANLLQYENQLSTFSGTPKFLQEEGAMDLIEEVSQFQVL